MTLGEVCEAATVSPEESTVVEAEEGAMPQEGTVGTAEAGEAAEAQKRRLLFVAAAEPRLGGALSCGACDAYPKAALLLLQEAE